MRRDDYRATLVMMVGLAAATGTGFLRQATIAHELGAGRAADVYLVAFSVPEFVFVALPIVLSPAFIPLLIECRTRAGEAGARRFGLQVAGALAVLLIGAAALAGLGAPLYLHWLAPGFGGAERGQAAQAMSLMLPAIVLMGLGTLAGAALQVYRHFARPALATAAFNLVLMVTLLAAPLGGPIVRAAWGVTFGACAALLIQWPWFWGRRAPAIPAGAQLPDVGQVARLAGPLAAGYAVHHLILFVDRGMATGLGSGGVAVLDYAYRLALVVGQLSGLAVSTAVFPRLAESIGSGQLAEGRKSLADALRLVWGIALPASAGLVVLRTPAVHLLFERGAFDGAATAAVAGVLGWYALSVLADALCQPLWRAVYAQRATWTVVAVNGLQTCVRLGCNVALSAAFGYNGLAFSAAIGLSVQAIVLAWLVGRRMGRYTSPAWWRDMMFAALATVAAVATTSLAIAGLSSAPAWRVLAAGGAVGAVTYVLVVLSLKLVTKGYPWNRNTQFPIPPR